MKDDARPRPANDNLEIANDNRRRDYQRNYMARRRQGGKTLKSLLKEGLHVVEAQGARLGDDPEAQAFIAAVRELLGAPEKRKTGCKGARP